MVYWYWLHELMGGVGEKTHLCIVVSVCLNATSENGHYVTKRT